MTHEANIIQSAVVQTISPNAQQRRRRRRKPRAQRDNTLATHPIIDDDPLTTTLQIQTARVSQSFRPQGSLYATHQPSRNPRIRNIPPPPPPLTPPPPSPPPPTQPPPPTRTFRNRRGNGAARLSSAASPIVPSLSLRQNTSQDSPTQPNNNRRGGPRRGNRRGGNRQGLHSGGLSRSESVYTGVTNSPPESSSPTTSRNPNRNYRARRGAQRGPPRSAYSIDHSSAPATANNISNTSNVRQNSSSNYSRGVVSATAPQRARPYGDQPAARMTNATGSSNIALATQMLRTVAEQWSNNASLNEPPVTSRPTPSIPIRTSTSVASTSAHASRSVQYSPMRGGVTTTASVSYQGVSIGTSVAYASGLGSARVTSAQTTVAANRPSWVQLLPTRHFTVQNAPRERQCSICLEDLVGARCRVLPCFHAFHIACVDQWFELSDTCPLDRKCVPHMLRQSGQIIGSDTESRDSWGSSGDYYDGHHPVRGSSMMMPPLRPIPADGDDLSAGLLQSVGRMVRNLLGL